jgi:hypothetical protein
LTIDIIHSPKWRELQKAYREIWLPLMAEKEVEK